MKKYNKEKYNKEKYNKEKYNKKHNQMIVSGVSIFTDQGC